MLMFVTVLLIWTACAAVVAVAVGSGLRHLDRTPSVRAPAAHRLVR